MKPRMDGEVACSPRERDSGFTQSEDQDAILGLEPDGPISVKQPKVVVACPSECVEPERHGDRVELTAREIRQAELPQRLDTRSPLGIVRVHLVLELS